MPVSEQVHRAEASEGGPAGGRYAADHASKKSPKAKEAGKKEKTPGQDSGCACGIVLNHSGSCVHDVPW